MVDKTCFIITRTLTINDVCHYHTLLEMYHINCDETFNTKMWYN